MRVTGGELEQPIYVRARLSSYRARIVGLSISNDAEVTSASLRRLRLGRIARELHEFAGSESGNLAESLDATRDEWLVTREARLEDANRSIAVGKRDGTYKPTDTDRTAMRAELAARQRADDAEATWAVFQDWRASVADAADTLDGRQRGRGSKAPTNEELQSFAKAYLDQLIEEPRGAVTRTADKLHFDRATAYRWLKLCRESTPPLLPPKDA